ncbi:MAG: acetolactate synthase large subunit [Myxococcota bacterium]
MPTGAVRLLETAAAAGVEICFANPGTTEMPLVAALDAVPGVRAILGLFEGVCTGAADGWGRMTRRPALTLLHLGPGFANGIANLHNARRAHTPIVNLIGDQARDHLAHDAPLTSDISSLARPVSNWLRTARSPDELAADFAEAIAAAHQPPGQISTLVIPADVQWGETRAAVPPTPKATTPNDVDEATVASVAERLRAARSPALLLGAGALDAAGQRAAGRIFLATGARLLAETFPARWERGGDLPVLERLPYFPEQAIAALADCDALVLAGAREPVAFFGYPDCPSRLAPEESLVRLSDPAQDNPRALEALAAALDAGPWQAPAWTAQDAAVADEPLHPGAVGAVLARCLPEHAIVVEEAATSGLPFYAASNHAPRHSLLSLTGGAIGQGLPCAVGAALACPDRKVIAFQADGSAQYTVQALWTMARESLDVVVLLCSNRSYRILQIELARAGVSEPGAQAQSLMSLQSPDIDWCAIASGYGVPATRVGSAVALDAALRRALEEPGPSLLELSL